MGLESRLRLGLGLRPRLATGTQLRLGLNLDYNLDWEQDRNGELKRESSETGTLAGGLQLCYGLRFGPRSLA